MSYIKCYVIDFFKHRYNKFIMLRQKMNHPLPIHSPEDDLQEISMLEESNQLIYKTPASNAKTHGFHLDGWFTPSVQTQSLLKTYRSHIITANNTNSQCRKGQNSNDGSEGLEQHSSQHFSKKKQFANFRLKRAQSHEFQINYAPTSILKDQVIKPKNPQRTIRLSIGNFQLASNKKNQLNFISKRPIVQVFNYPLLKKFKENDTERKLTQNVGRVRRMLKLKLQHNNESYK